MNTVYINNIYSNSALQCSYKNDVLYIQHSKHNSIIIDFSNSYNINLQIDNFNNDYCIPVYYQHKNSKKTVGYILSNNGAITSDSIGILIDILQLHFGIYADNNDIFNIISTIF